jgi:hypothetical protein
MWRHKASGESYVVEVSSHGEILAAAGPVAYGDPYATLTGEHVLSPEALQFVNGARRGFEEDYELDEQGRLWTYAVSDSALVGAAGA